VRAVYLEHRALLWISTAYIAGGGLALAWLGREWPIRLTSGWLPLAWAVASLVWLFWQYLRHPRRARAILAPERLLGALLVILLVEPLQITLQALKQAIGQVVGFPLDPSLSRIDLLIHGTHAWIVYARLLPSWTWVRAIDGLYVVWFLVVIGFLFWASWSHVRALRQRALVAFLLLSISGATVAAWTGASAGPCYYRFNAPASSAGLYDELTDRLDAYGATGRELFARRTQRWLWDLHARDQAETFSGVSAMPSLHVANVVLFALVAWQRSRILGGLMAAYAAVIQVGSVILAWHYAVDGYVGAALAVACWVGAGVILRQGDRKPLHSSKPSEPSHQLADVV
jgi:hypothetical protein